MSVVSPTSIENQLAEYRRRKQEEERLAGLPPTPTEEAKPQTVTARTESPGHASNAFSGLLNGVQSIGERVSSSLYSIVAPDHLLNAGSSNRVGGGHTLRDVAPVVRQRFPHAMKTDAASSSPLLVADSQQDSGDEEDEVPTWSAHLANCFGRRTKLGWTALLMKLLLWLVLWKVFILWQFGAVFFLITGFVLIWYNLRSDPRHPDEVSAYSVFNRDLRRIDGTVSPEQLQREMLFM